MPWAVRADEEDMTRRPLSRAVLAAACAVLFVTSAPAADASADDVTVVVTLRPSDRAALARAATLPGRATPATRRTALAKARPTGTARVVDYLLRKGLSVTATNDWSVSAHGPRHVVRTIRHPDVAGVAGLGPRRSWKSRATGYTGADLASAYDVDPGGDGAGLTIATVQFSGWHASDLASYATESGLDQPDVTEVLVGSTPPATTDAGAFEVAMDQQVLLAAAPKAAQRIYFAKDEGLASAIPLYEQIADDAVAGLVDVVSTSWGMCERDADLDAAAREGIEVQLARIVGAGATVFAASGDLGAYDCGDEDPDLAEPSVDYPAASPYVVGVGGTTLAPDGAGWTETVWSDTANGWASGGGASSTVARPAWQSGVGVDGTTRLVPDVAAMADPRRGFKAYSSTYGGWVLGGGTSAGAPLLAGHLASALSAAGRTSGVGDVHDEMYASPQAFRDVTSGYNFFYAAAAGYDMATGLGTPRWGPLSDALLGDPVVSAPPVTKSLTVPLTVTPPPGVVTGWAVGEDTITCDTLTASAPTTYTFAPAADDERRIAVAAEVGAECRVGTVAVIVDTKKPVASGSISPRAYDNRAILRWNAADPAPSSGLTFDLCLHLLGSGCVWTRVGTASKTAAITLTPGRTYVLRVTPVDRAGNRGSQYVSPRWTVPLDQTSLTRSSGWTAINNSADWYGSHSGSVTRGAYLSKMLAGTKYDVIYLAHPKGGTFDVYLGGRFVRRISTYAPVRTPRKLSNVRTFSTRAARGLRIVVRSGHVSIDAVRVAY
jgi:hypothetical protein